MAHGLPTSYSDFLDWLKGTSYTHNNEHDFSSFVIQMENAFQHSDVDLWSDFENALGCLDVEEYLKEKVEFYKIEDRNDEHYGDPSQLSEQVYAEVEYIFKGMAVGEVHNLFSSWINSLPMYSNLVKEYDDIDPKGLFLTFNYTDTLERVYGVPEENVFHIHGRASESEDKIIVGHGNTYKENDYYEVVDSLFYGCDDGIVENIVDALNDLQKDTKHVLLTNKTWFDKLEISNIGRIVLYGLSFGEVDDPYFKEISQRLPNVEWHFARYAPTKKEEQKSLNRIREFIKRINIKGKCLSFDPDTVETEEEWLNLTK